MGKVSSWKCEPDLESNERNKKKKRKKELEELRRKVLAAKRSQQKKAAPKPKKSAFVRTLNEFAKIKKEIEEATKIQGPILLRPRNNDRIVPKPLNTRGFFRAGVKGRLIRRPSKDQEKFKNDVLQEDALQLLQSDSHLFNKPKEVQNKTTRNELVSKTRMETQRILKSSSESSCYDVDDLSSVEKDPQFSPILGGGKSFKKKIYLTRSNVNGKSKDVLFQKNKSPKTSQIVKEEKCKRRLFVNEISSVNNENFESSNNYNSHENIEEIRFSPRRQTPENVIFFTEHLPQENVNKINKKCSTHKMDIRDPLLIKCYIMTCKVIARNELKDALTSNVKSPLEIAKATLKATYANTFKDYVNRQKQAEIEERFHSEEKSTPSSSSEIMLEPDSAIARTLKKNIQAVTKNTKRISESNSNSSATDISGSDTAQNNQMKRKRAPSSKGEHSEVEYPSSTKVNFDPKSVKVDPTMSFINPERQELIVRYLRDINTNNKKNTKEHAPVNQKISRESNNIKKTYLAHKGAKHIPSILRKSRSLADCIAKEKKLLNIETHIKADEVANKISIPEISNESNNIKTERTPNCGNVIPNQLIEAPKCKYMYMNAKYNQPSRIHVPLPNRRLQKNNITERHLFPTPSNTEKDYLITQNLKLKISPIKQQSNLLDSKMDFHLFQSSQETSEQNSNCMTRMASFGEIQERTDRLTLCSQNQKCSQESSEQLHSQEECSNSNINYYYQQHNPPNNFPYNNLKCVRFKEMPSPQTFNRTMSSDCNHYPHHAIKCEEEAMYVPKNDFQIISPENCSFSSSKNCSCCSLNDCQIYGKSNSQQYYEEPVINCVPVQQQNICQPIKYIAVEENRIAQRRPIYSTNDSNSCSHVHKKSLTNQQYAQVMKPCYSRDVPNQLCYTMSSAQCPPQGTSQSFMSPRFDHKTNNIVVPNLQRSSNFSSDHPGLKQNSMNYILSNTSDQNFIAQQRVPMHASINNQRYIGQQQQMQMQMQMPSTMYSQVGYQRNHCSNNEGYKINEVYLQQVNRNNHSKRP